MGTHLIAVKHPGVTNYTLPRPLHLLATAPEHYFRKRKANRDTKRNINRTAVTPSFFACYLQKI